MNKELKLNQEESELLHKAVIDIIIIRSRYRSRLKRNGIDVENGDTNDLYNAINAGYASLIEAVETNENLTE